MNVAYDEAEKRGFVRLTLISLGFTVGGIVLLLAIIAVTLVLPLALERVGLGSQAERLVRIGSPATLFVAALVALSALYRWGPSRAEARWRWITPGAVIAVFVAGFASALFSWYVARFGSYNETYGSLGAVIGFMTWLWIMVAFVITGAELNAEMEHQTAQDSTTGPAEPIGTRGARMADTVASGPNDLGPAAAPGRSPEPTPAATTQPDGRSRGARPTEDLSPTATRASVVPLLALGTIGLVLVGLVGRAPGGNRGPRAWQSGDGRSAR